MKKLLLAFCFTCFGVFAFGVEAQQRFRGMELGAGTTGPDVDDMRALLGNPNFVRIALIVPGADSMTLAEYEAGLAVELQRADGLLVTLAQYGMKAYVAMHTPPGGFADRTFPAQHNLFSAQQWQDAVVRIWGEIATRYKDNATVAGYDLLNEPAQRNVAAGLKDWVGLYEDIVSSIRAVDPDKLLCIQPKYGNISFLKTSNVIVGDNLCYSFHLYFPNSFINQGLNGGPTNKKYTKKHKKKLVKLLNRVKKFQKKSKKKLGYVPPIYLGEFSVVRWAPENFAVKYLRDVTKFADKRKWDWSYQAWRGSHEWDLELTSEQSSFEPAVGITARAEVLKQAFEKN